MQEGYCRMLGHHLQFKYCRTVKDGLPCHKVLDCWFEQFPVEEFIKKNYTEEELKTILAPPPAKMDSLLDMIKKAKKNTDES